MSEAASKRWRRRGREARRLFPAYKNKVPRGRPKYKPTEADRYTVRSMAATGFAHTSISNCLGISGIDEKTLRKHFRHELDTAADKANAAVANKAYQMAIAGDPPAATFFWLKCRAGWKETDRLDLNANIRAIEREDIEARVSELEQAAELTKAGGKTVTRRIVRSNAGWGLALDRDACIQILGECGFLPTGSLGLVNLSEIPDGLNVEETEKFLRENAAEICGSRRAQNDGAGA